MVSIPRHMTCTHGSKEAAIYQARMCDYCPTCNSVNFHGTEYIKWTPVYDAPKPRVLNNIELALMHHGKALDALNNYGGVTRVLALAALVASIVAVIIAIVR